MACQRSLNTAARVSQNEATPSFASLVCAILCCTAARSAWIGMGPFSTARDALRRVLITASDALGHGLRDVRHPVELGT